MGACSSSNTPSEPPQLVGDRNVDGTLVRTRDILAKQQRKSARRWSGAEKPDSVRARAVSYDMSEKKASQKLPKVLLLGAGGCGKSTLFKQLMLAGSAPLDRSELIPTIHNSVFVSIEALCQKARIVEKEESRKFIQNLPGHIQALWRDPAIQAAFMETSFTTKPLPENAKYFLDRVDTLGAEEYIPSNEDLLKCYARTTGIVEYAVLEDTKFVVLDVGGQRVERKKWVHCFEEVNSFIFIVGLSDYHQTMLEDPEQNRLAEQLKLFEGVLDLCPTKPIVLLFSKADLLREKLADPRAPLVSTLFPDYRGENEFDSVVEWFKRQFLMRNKNAERDVMVQVLDLTDTGQALHVMGLVKQFVVAQVS